MVAVINTSEDISTMLAQAVEEEGFRAAVAYVTDLREGRMDLNGFLSEHDPRAIIWDIAIPYDVNWQFFLTCQQQTALRNCPVILTTTNKGALESLVGPTGTLEIIGKPYDLFGLMQKVREAVESSGAGTPRV
jgi:DNA-binding NtrC family response regulator